LGGRQRQCGVRQNGWQYEPLARNGFYSFKNLRCGFL
jgi:hypothetical protein